MKRSSFPLSLSLSLPRTAAVLLALLCLQAGCTAITNPNPGAPDHAPVAPSMPVAPVDNHGAIFQAGNELLLFADVRGRRVGDLLTVLLRERTDAAKRSSASAGKNTELSIAVDEWNIGSRNYSSGSEFDGGGRADQSNELSGEITVVVAEVLANGVMVVQGEKWMTINQGREFVRIRGMVRPADVRPDNTVLSERLADARIAYGGEGMLADTARAGWLTRFFQSPAWPL